MKKRFDKWMGMLLCCLSVSTVTFLTSCGGGDNSSSEGPTVTETNFEKAVKVVNAFDITTTHGYDYSLSQYLGNDVTNSHEISLRADFSGQTKAEKNETSKTLNDFEADTQYTVESVHSYFYNNRMAVESNGYWNWTNCKERDYFSCNISSFDFNTDYFESVKEDSQGTYSFKATVKESQIESFVGFSSSIEDISIIVKVDSNFSNLISLELQYFQKTTYTEIKFTSYSGTVDIRIPGN